MAYFSLIIATFNRMEHHINLLKSLKEQTFRDFEIVVIDQNAHDNLKNCLTADLKDFNLVYLHVKKNMGLSAARNYGMKHASGRIIAFPDDDCWYQPRTLELVYERFSQDDSINTVTGLVTDVDGSFSAGGYMIRNKQVRVSNSNAWWTTNSSSIFIKREVLEAIGEFDENIGLGTQRYISGEETDLILRIHKLGYKVNYYPEINVFHKRYRGVYDKTERKRGYGYGLGMGYVLRKNGYGLDQLIFYSGIHWGKGTLFLLSFRARRALFHYNQAWGRIRGWFEYGKIVKKGNSPTSQLDK